ncbi:M55 family metallopeptidase [Paraburkholderia humisilvae]
MSRSCEAHKPRLRATEGADAAILVGWHAKAGTPRACLPHTYTERIKRLTIDGREVGESAC